MGKCLGESAWLIKTLYHLFQAINPKEAPFLGTGENDIPHRISKVSISRHVELLAASAIQLISSKADSLG